VDAPGAIGHPRAVPAADGPSRDLGWPLPLGALLCGWGSLPLLLVSSTAFVLSAVLILIALGGAVLVAAECRASWKTAVALLGALGALVAPAAIVLGLLLQE